MPAFQPRMIVSGILSGGPTPCRLGHVALRRRVCLSTAPLSGDPANVHMPGLNRATDRQQRIMRLASDLAALLAERVQTNDVRSLFPHENYRDLHESGYLRLALPQRFGGEGADVFEMTLAQEVLARGDASTALVVGMMLSLLGASSRPEPGRNPFLPTSAGRSREMAEQSTTA